MVVVSDIYAGACEVLGRNDAPYVYGMISSAIEVLASKQSPTGQTIWDPLMVYVNLPVQADYFVALPPHVDKPLAVNLNNEPAFNHDQFFEFMMDGPGSSVSENGLQWQDRGQNPLQRFLPIAAAPNPIQFNSSAPADLIAGLTLSVTGTVADGSEHTYAVPLNNVPFSVQFVSITSIVKPVTVGNISLVSNERACAVYYPQTTFPMFSWIKLSQKAMTVRALCRRRTAAVSAMTDVIPLNSRLAIIHMIKALKWAAEDNFDASATNESFSIKLLTEEQMARNAYQQATGSQQMPSALNLNITTRDCVLVSDIYDDACVIVGPVGRAKLFDRITMAIEALANATQWKPQIGYMSINTTRQLDVYGKPIYFVTLPRYVEQVLAMTVNGSRGDFRNEWLEFSTSGPSGGDSSMPCDGWTEVGEVVTTWDPLITPFQLVATPQVFADSNAFIRVFGLDRNGNPVFDPLDKELGYIVPCQSNLLAYPVNAPWFSRIDRVSKAVTSSYINLYVWSGTTTGQQLAMYWPDDQEPKYERIKIAQPGQSITMRYRKRWTKIQSLADPILLRSRQAVLHALQAIQTGAQDPSGAIAILGVAVQLLNNEWRANNPNAGVALRFNPRIWGGSMTQMT